MTAGDAAEASPPDPLLGLVPAAPTVPIRTLVRRFWPYARPDRTRLLAGLAAAALIPAVEAAEIWLFKIVVDDVLVPRDLSPLAWLALAYLGLSVLSASLSFVDEYVGAWVGERFLLRLRADVLRHLLRRSPDGLDRGRPGDVLARLTSDAAVIERLVPSGLADLVGSVLRIAVFTGALFVLDWPLALVSLCVVPPLWAAGRRLARSIRRASRQHRRSGGAAAAVAEDVLANLALVQSHTREEEDLGRFVAQGESAVRAKLRATRLRASLSSLVDVLEVAAALAVIGAGTWALATGRLTLGGLFVFLTFLGQLYRPVRDLAQLGDTVFSASAGGERILELLDQPPEVTTRPGARALAATRGRVRFDEVWFTYPGAPLPVLHGVSLRLEPGEMVALVGASGSGKSTLVKLLLRFHDPSEGAVRIDGLDLRDITIDSLRSLVGVVLQDSFAVDRTIRQNVAYGRPEATDEQIAGALRTVGLAPWVGALPDGIATPVGSRGRHLSGGQRRRLAVARALLRDAPILVLDEPLTGLDAESAAALSAELRHWTHGRTTLVVAHDLSVAHAADRVAVLDGGRIVEQGTHVGLLAAGGAYAAMWRRHAGRGREAVPTPPVEVPAGAEAGP